MRLRAAGIAVLALLIAPATASASAWIDVECERVRFNYSQWTSGPPDTSRSTVWVDGVIVFDEVVSFPGSTHVVDVPLNLNDGKEHTIEARHDWINHETGTQEVRETVTCGAPPPPAEQPPPPPEQPPAPPAPTTPASAPTPPASGSAPERGGTAPTKAERQKAKRQKAKQQKAKRRRQRQQARRERQRAQERATSNRLPRTTG